MKITLFFVSQPAQSPQQHGGYMQSVYNVNPNDANPSSMINQSPSTKPNSNGQHMWQMTQMQQFGQGQHQQVIKCLNIKVMFNFIMIMKFKDRVCVYLAFQKKVTQFFCEIVPFVIFFL